MSKCELQIVLERTDGRYAMGEHVRGIVRVQVNASCSCKKLTLNRGWRTHGKGNRNKGPKAEIILYSGILEPGRHEYPFEFLAPNGPVTYHGHYLNVDWHLNARADIPWAIDPRAETEFLLERGDYLGEIDVGDGPAVTKREELQKALALQGRAYGCFALLVASVGAVVLAVALLAGESPRSYLIGAVIAGIFLLAGAIVAYRSFRNVLAERVLGDVNVTLSTAELTRGEEVTCTLTFCPKSTVKLSEIAATLECNEVVDTGNGSDRVTHRHSLYTHKESMVAKKQASVGREVTLSAIFVIPEGLPASFHVLDNQLDWRILVAIDAPGLPAWSGDHQIIVS